MFWASSCLEFGGLEVVGPFGFVMSHTEGVVKDTCSDGSFRDSATGVLPKTSLGKVLWSPDDGGLELGKVLWAL